MTSADSMQARERPGPAPSARRARSRALACVAAVSALATWAGGCGEEPAAPASRPRPVKVYAVGGSTADGVPQYTGVVAAATEVEMAFDVPGRIVRWDVQEGQRVEAGEVVAALDARDYSAELDAQIARLRFAEAEYERQRELFESDSISRREYDVARRRLDVVRAETAIARKAVEDTRLRAPFTGVLARKLVTDLANVQAKEPVLLLQNDTSLEIRVAVPEGDVALARRDISVEERTERARPVVTISSFPDRQFDARITEMATSADPTTRTFRVTLAIERPDDVNLQPGMTATVTATGLAGAELGVLVPATAVIATTDREAMVWVVDPKTMTVSKRTVKLGELTGAQVEVLEGLSRGDVIATTGAAYLTEGQAVRVLRADGAIDETLEEPRAPNEPPSNAPATE